MAVGSGHIEDARLRHVLQMVQAQNMSVTDALRAFDALHTIGADVASASTLDLAATGGWLNTVTGTTQIDGINEQAAGKVRRLIFQSSLTLNYNSTSFILPGLSDVVTAAGDIAEFLSLGSGNWKCINYYSVTSFAPSYMWYNARNYIFRQGVFGYFDFTLDDVFEFGTDLWTWVPTGGTMSGSFIPGSVPGTAAERLLGNMFYLYFAGVTVIRHNGFTIGGFVAAIGEQISLPGGANITTAAGDMACFVFLSSDPAVSSSNGQWYCVSYQRAAGTPIKNKNLTGGVTTVDTVATVVTNANLTGEVTSVGNSATMAISALTAADAALTDLVPEYNQAATANRTVTVSRLLGLAGTSVCEGRLSLTSGLSVTTADVTGATSIYFALHTGDKITIYDGTRLRLYTFAELTLALGTLVNAQAYDVFVYDNSGTLTLESLEWQNATITCTNASPGVVTWTSHGLATGNSITFTNSGGALPTGISANTQYWITKIDANTFKLSTSLANVAAGTFVNTSSTGTGTHTGHSPTNRQTALVKQNGAWYKTGALTRRYLGSFMTTSTTTTENSLLNALVFNAHNRTEREIRVTDATATWNYSTNSYHQANASVANVINVLIGLSEDPVRVTAMGSCFNSTATGRGVYVATGIDSTSASAGTGAIVNPGATCTSGIIASPMSQYVGYPGVGYHALTWLERGAGTDTQTWIGASTTGLIGTVRS